MSVSSMSDLDNEAAPKKASFGDAASKMGGGNNGLANVAMITKSLVKVCTDCLTNVVSRPQRIYNPITAIGFSAMFTFQLDNTKR